MLHECMLVGWCDVLGVQFAPRVGRPIPAVRRAIAVELKLKKIAEVIAQASANRYAVHESWAAMPAALCDRMRPDTLAKFEKAGVGLLQVDDAVAVLVKPIVMSAESWRIQNVDDVYRKRWWSGSRRAVRRERKQ